MNILVVHGQRLENYPPVRSLIDILTRNGHKVTIITKCGEDPGITNPSLLKIIRLPENDNQKSALNAVNYFRKKRIMTSLVEREMKNNDILWTTTDSTVRDLGDIVFRYRHVMQLMELIEDMPAVPGLKYPTLNIKKYAQKAYKVVVPEYNRAQIQKTWWELKKLPDVLPNKMSSTEIPEPKDEIRELLNKIDSEGSKIILYQGSFSGDRNLDVFAEAINALDGKYALYLMGRDSEERKLLCSKYPRIQYIPFIAPPYHLLVSRRAYIGLLPYVPGRIGFNSVLNALYCAPNKIFEFSGFGVPMLGNDVPGLTIPFEAYNIGKVRKEGTVDEIRHLIELIDANHNVMSENCIRYYNSFDLDSIVNRIIEE